LPVGARPELFVQDPNRPLQDGATIRIRELNGDIVVAQVSLTLGAPASRLRSPPPRERALFM